MTSNWKKFRLEDLKCADSLITYGVIKPGEPGKVIFIRGGDLLNGQVLYSQLRTISRKVSDQYQRTILRGGELLISLVGQPGQVAVAPTELAGANIARQVGMIRLRSDVNVEYISYFLQSPDGKKELGTHTGGSVQQVINLADLRTVSVPMASLPEQQRIVELLDEAFSGIATAKANAEKNLQNASALFESHLQSIFTLRGQRWNEKPLSEICTFSSGGTPSKSNGSYWTGDIPWISGRDMKSTRLSDSLLHISQSAIDESATRVAPAGTLLVLVRGMGLAHGPQIGELMVPCAFNQDIKALHPFPDLLPRFLLFALRDQIRISNTVLSSAAHGTLKIDSDQLSKIAISYPSLAEQQRIVTTIDDLAQETHRLAAIYERKIAALDELKKSLLHQAFTGRLTANWRPSNVIAFPVALPGIASLDLHAGLVAMTHLYHVEQGTEKYCGHVKMEKSSHVYEAHHGLELDRNPYKDAAGPNDWQRLLEMEEHARKKRYFDIVGTEEKGYTLKPLSGYDALIKRTRRALGNKLPQVEEFLRLTHRMNKETIEVLATLYAAWNNLLLDQEAITDERIVYEARENWHKDKLRIEREVFFKMLTTMRDNGLVPTGRAKRVVAKA
jgi:type I restriction enzyme S subunit